MRAGIRISSLVPSGLVIESVSDSSDSIILVVRSEGGMVECPLCGTRSRRIHSRYERQVADLPCAGKQVRLRVITRRFVCEVPHCRRRIFAERFWDDVLPTRSRRTARLECIVHHLGLALAHPSIPDRRRFHGIDRLGCGCALVAEEYLRLPYCVGTTSMEVGIFARHDVSRIVFGLAELIES